MLSFLTESNNHFINFQIEYGSYPDKTYYLKNAKELVTLLTSTCDDSNNYKIQNENDYNFICWNYNNMEEFQYLILLVYKIREIRPYLKLKLFMPYIPNARMDRVKNIEDINTLKIFMNQLNNLNFDKVIVLDPHSPVSEGMLNNYDVVKSRKLLSLLLEKVLKDYDPDIIIFPDNGAEKRYSEFILPILKKCFTKEKIEELIIGIGNKKRKWETGEIQSVTCNFFDINNKETELELIINTGEVNRGKNKCLIIDDICSKGGTFYYLIKSIKEDLKRGFEQYPDPNLKFSLFVSHLEDIVQDGDIYKEGLIENLYTTDSISSLTESDIDKDKIKSFDKYNLLQLLMEVI